ncbi:MAG: hypothetical protein HPY87_00085 [Fervidobacterium sp.]|uniref:hypothetical protein n=1 Tax=Fervidobacterium sp. TaxID=1871331 RepID=UPI0025C467A1|nr:hypothetical protein [Fervidobacterium sp.]NPU88333.1 hypothetical protein [Fervidobacterium sp.]
MTILNYNFQGPYSLDGLEKIQNVSGVYVVTCTDIFGKSLLLDVGESGELRERLKKHDRMECWKKHCKSSIQVYVHYTIGMREDERKKIEQRIRSSYKLPCGER